MNKPIQFISIDSDGVCKLTEEAEEMISKINDNIAVICVAGLYRTGKSYLLNRLLGRQDGFEIGPTINSCTKGLWIWGKPVTLDDKNLKVLLIDTEGLGSSFEDRNETIDMEIFCLGVLLSSLFVYNSMKHIDESAVEALALVLNFSKKIQSSYKELDNYSNNFPSLLWVLRDFALELTDSNGKPMSPNQYLENSLRSIDTTDPETIKKNDIRNILRIFFKERECYTLIRPINDEKKLRNIDKIPVNELRSEFVKQMDSLVNKIYNNIRPKVVQGSYLNGKMFINLVKMYVESLNSDILPDVKTSWKIVVEQQMDEIYDRSLNYYIEEMLCIDYNKVSKIEDLIKFHNNNKLIAFDYLKELSNVNVPISVYLDFMKKLEIRLNEQFDQFSTKWNEMTAKTCQNISEQIIKEYKESNDTTDIFVALDMIEDVFKLIDDSVTSDKKYELIYPVLLNFFIDLFKKGFKIIKSNYENQISNLTQDKTLLQSMLDKTKDTLEKTQEDYEIQVRELKDNQMNLRLELEAKIDEKNLILNKVKDSHDNTVEELSHQIEILKKQLEKKKYELEDKRNKKEYDPNHLESILELKIDGILNKLDNHQEILIRNELEKAKLHLKLEVNTKIDELENEFIKKLNNAKKICEKTISKLKTNFQEENASLKQLIKELYDDINDFKVQVNSQDYKIELYKEKIINYEKEKKSQTDHAELLRILTQKLNNYIELLSKR